MYFPASVNIANQHPDLADTLGELDGMIYETGDEPLRAGVIADTLGIGLSLTERILAQFEQEGILRREVRHYCRVCDVLLEILDGALWCDACERKYTKSTAHAETVLIAVDPMVRRDDTNDDRVGASELMVLQFIAGDRGGAQRAQVQSPREYDQIRDAFKRGMLRERFVLAPAIFAATVQKIASAYAHNPTILHFAGNGDDRSLSVIEDRGALVRAQPLRAEQLRNILLNYPRRVRVSVFNTCDSHTIAEELATACTVDIAIGWKGKVADNIAINFATAFYEHLGNDLSCGRAFSLAQACLEPGTASVHLSYAETVTPIEYYISRSVHDPSASGAFHGHSHSTW